MVAVNFCQSLPQIPQSARQTVPGPLQEFRAIGEDLKSAPWKVMLAAVLKRHTSAPNVWITRMLNMGIPQAVSQKVGRLDDAGGEKSENYRRLRAAMTQDLS